eukprot:TRINITY_DN14882_c0_g1_i1.p1 TRINITY_DN14882_c0_g1~~TRINITY_DN14882_c0_g1_i1.p1  ORF type:complete len:679 (+),score=14.24 TRINITY_DN14882_c0_g1_i1:105-2039(+)
MYFQWEGADLTDVGEEVGVAGLGVCEGDEIRVCASNVVKAEAELRARDVPCTADGYTEAFRRGESGIVALLVQAGVKPPPFAMKTAFELHLTHSLQILHNALGLRLSYQDIKASFVPTALTPNSNCDKMLDCLSECVNTGIFDINTPHPDGSETLLTVSCGRLDIPIIKRLVDMGANSNFIDCNGKDLLSKGTCSVTALEYLYSTGNVKYSPGRTLLDVSFERGLAMIELYEKIGYPKHCPEGLVVACAEGRLDIVEHFVTGEDPVDPNVVVVSNGQRKHPLIEAILSTACRSLEVMKYLLSNGADPNITISSRRAHSPLDAVFRSLGTCDPVTMQRKLKCLIDNRLRFEPPPPTPPPTVFWTVLIAAKYPFHELHGYPPKSAISTPSLSPSLLSKLLKCDYLNLDMLINATGCIEPPIIALAKCGKDAAVDLLVKNGADVNQRDAFKRTALHYARERKMQEYLLSKGASADVLDVFRNTPIMHLKSCGANVFGALMEKSDLTVRNINGECFDTIGQNNAVGSQVAEAPEAPEELPLHAENGNLDAVPASHDAETYQALWLSGARHNDPDLALFNLITNLQNYQPSLDVFLYLAAGLYKSGASLEWTNLNAGTTGTTTQDHLDLYASSIEYKMINELCNNRVNA